MTEQPAKTKILLIYAIMKLTMGLKLNDISFCDQSWKVRFNTQIRFNNPKYPKLCNFKLLKMIEWKQKHMLPNQSMPCSGLFESKLRLINKQ